VELSRIGPERDRRLSSSGSSPARPSAQARSPASRASKGDHRVHRRLERAVPAVRVDQDRRRHPQTQQKLKDFIDTTRANAGGGRVVNVMAGVNLSNHDVISGATERVVVRERV